MKRFLVILLLAAVGLQSCKKDDNTIFDQTPDERLNAKLAEYLALLSGAQNGWKAVLTTDSSTAGPYQGSYGFYFKFDNANRVKMYSDWDSASAVTLKESSYRLKALQQPSLIFDTYSYLHVLADPNPNVNGGDPETNTGLYSDFEFYFDAASTDTVKLIGRFNGSKLTLVRATAQEATAYNSGQLASGLLINRLLTYFKRLTIGTQLIDIKVFPVERLITLSYLDGSGNIQIFTTPYYFTAGGIVFLNALKIGTLTITGFNNMTWVSSSETINATVGNTAATIRAVIFPIKVDLNAPRRWWDYAISIGGAYWASAYGFHVNGVDDAYGITSLRSGTDTYYYLLYWPGYATNNDFLGPAFLNAAQTGLSPLVYGLGPRRTYTADGRMVFTPVSTYGTYPSTGPAANTRAKLYDASGYYFVQTGQESYDMISASDGKAWISWQIP